MTKLGLSLDSETGCLRVGGEELILHRHNTSAIRVLSEQDIHLSPRNDNVITGRLENSSRNEITGIIEPTDAKQVYKGVIMGNQGIRLSSIMGDDSE